MYICIYIYIYKHTCILRGARVGIDGSTFLLGWRIPKFITGLRECRAFDQHLLRDPLGPLSPVFINCLFMNFDRSSFFDMSNPGDQMQQVGTV